MTTERDHEWPRKWPGTTKEGPRMTTEMTRNHKRDHEWPRKWPEKGTTSDHGYDQEPQKGHKYKNVRVWTCLFVGGWYDLHDFWHIVVGITGDNQILQCQRFAAIWRTAYSHFPRQLLFSKTGYRWSVNTASIRFFEGNGSICNFQRQKTSISVVCTMDKKHMISILGFKYSFYCKLE